MKFKRILYINITFLKNSSDSMMVFKNHVRIRICYHYCKTYSNMIFVFEYYVNDHKIYKYKGVFSL
jgi:hypothetical protein